MERSDLAALEFLMSKQPRGNVRVGAGNAAGARVSNIFVDVKKFQNRYDDAMNKANTQSSKVSPPNLLYYRNCTKEISIVQAFHFIKVPTAMPSGSINFKRF